MKMVRAAGRRGRRDGVNNARYKGVRMRKWGKWVAEVRQPNSRDRIWLGSYDRPEEAARAYDAAVFCLRGPSAMLNFPSDPPVIPAAGELSPPQIQVAASRHARRVAEEVGSQTSVEGTVAAELTGPVMEAAVFEEESELFGEFLTKECYFGTNERGDDEDNMTGGTFYETPRLWTF